jgi:hypothetical protein
MQVGNEDVIQFIDEDAGCQVIGDCTLAEVEDKRVAVTQFHLNRGIHLAGAQHGCDTHKGKSHFVRLYFLSVR